MVLNSETFHNNVFFTIAIAAIAKVFFVFSLNILLIKFQAKSLFSRINQLRAYKIYPGRTLIYHRIFVFQITIGKETYLQVFGLNDQACHILIHNQYKVQ